MAEKYWQVVDIADTKKSVEGKCRCHTIVFKIYMHALSLCKMQVADGNSSVGYSCKQRDTCKGMKNLQYSFEV